MKQKRAGISEPSAETLRAALSQMASPAQAANLLRFFKTGPGQYGEGDRFLGLKVPQIRAAVRLFRDMPPEEAASLVMSPIHEERLAGVLLWVGAFERGTAKTRKQIFELYLRHTRHINNWDLVDLSAPQIVGGFLTPGDMKQLRTLARSDLLWERRIAVLATFAFIRQGVFAPTLELCRMLITDKHDLMHKACGWMLREVGKRNRAALGGFLDAHATTMPRTMLRYALEHYDAGRRRHYMGLRRTTT